MCSSASLRVLPLGLLLLAAACAEPSSENQRIDSPEPPRAATRVDSPIPTVDYFKLWGFSPGTASHEYVVTNVGQGSGAARFTCSVTSGPANCASVSPESAFLSPGETIHVTIEYMCCLAYGTSVLRLTSSLGGSSTHTAIATEETF